jgi:hypothetical protein
MEELGDASFPKYEALLAVGDRGEVGPSPGLEGTGGPEGRGGTARCEVSGVSTVNFWACNGISSSDSDPAVRGRGGGGRAAPISFVT